MKGITGLSPDRRNLLRLRVAALAMSLVAGFLMTSCGKNRASENVGEIVISFWNGYTGPGTKHIEELVADFNATRQGRIRVEMSIMLWGDYYIKLPLSLKGRMPPDCGATHVPQTTAFARAGMLVPVGPYLGAINQDDFFRNAWEAGEVDGQRYGIPMAVNPLVLLWNKKLFRDAGLDPERPPETREEFVRFAKQLTRDTDGDGTIDVWGTMIPIGWPSHYTYYSILRSNGGRLVSEDEKSCLCGGEAGVDAAQFLYDLVHEHKVSPPNVEVNADVEGFCVGKSAMEINGLWMLPQFQDTPGLDFGCVMLPNLGKSERKVWSSSENLVVFNHRFVSPARTQACVDFFTYLSTRGAKWAQVGTLPIRKSLYRDGQIDNLPRIMAVYPDVDSTEFPIRSLFVEECLGPVVEALFKVLGGDGDPQTEMRRGAEMSSLLLQQEPD